MSFDHHHHGGCDHNNYFINKVYGNDPSITRVWVDTLSDSPYKVKCCLQALQRNSVVHELVIRTLNIPSNTIMPAVSLEVYKLFCVNSTISDVQLYGGNNNNNNNHNNHHGHNNNDNDNNDGDNTTDEENNTTDGDEDENDGDDDDDYYYIYSAGGGQHQAIAESLCKGLGENDAVRKLDLRMNGLEGGAGGHCLSQLLLRNHTLTELHVSDNFLGEEGARTFAAGLSQSSLQSLHILHCQLGPAGCAAVCEGLRHNTCLREFHLGANGIGLRGLQAVLDLFEMNTTLAVLILNEDGPSADSPWRQDSNNAAFYDDHAGTVVGSCGGMRATAVLARLVRNSTSLRKLSVSLWHHNFSSLSPLLHALTCNDALSSFSLHRRGLDAAAICELAHCLPSIRGLTELSFAWGNGLLLHQRASSPSPDQLEQQLEEDEEEEGTVRALLAGLHQNQSLLQINTTDKHRLPAATKRKWELHAGFVVARNRVQPLLVRCNNKYKYNYEEEPVPAALWPHILAWTSGSSSSGGNGGSGCGGSCTTNTTNAATTGDRGEIASLIQTSLIHHVLRFKVNDLVGGGKGKGCSARGSHGEGGCGEEEDIDHHQHLLIDERLQEEQDGEEDGVDAAAEEEAAVVDCSCLL